MCLKLATNGHAGGFWSGIYRRDGFFKGQFHPDPEGIRKPAIVLQNVFPRYKLTFCSEKYPDCEMERAFWQNCKIEVSISITASSLSLMLPQ